MAEFLRQNSETVFRELENLVIFKKTQTLTTTDINIDYTHYQLTDQYNNIIETLCPYDEDSLTFNIDKIFNSDVNANMRINDIWNYNLKIFNDHDIHEYEYALLFNMIRKNLYNYCMMNAYEQYIINSEKLKRSDLSRLSQLSNDISKISTSEDLLKDKHGSDINFMYRNHFLQFTTLFNLFRTIVTMGDYINKFIVYGSGNNYAQILPDFIVNDIKEYGKKYEIFIIEDCNDDNFGCPSDIQLDKILKQKHIDSSLIKFHHIKEKVNLLSIWCILTYICRGTGLTFITSDTIGTGDEMEKIIYKYNNVYIEYKKFCDTNSFENKINLNNLVNYMTAGNKFIYFNNKTEKYVGFQVNGLVNCSSGRQRMFCPLNILDKSQINNFIGEDIKNHFVEKVQLNQQNDIEKMEMVEKAEKDAQKAKDDKRNAENKAKREAFLKKREAEKAAQAAEAAQAVAEAAAQAVVEAEETTGHEFKLIGLVKKVATHTATNAIATKAEADAKAKAAAKAEEEVVKLLTQHSLSGGGKWGKKYLKYLSKNNNSKKIF